MIILEKTRNSCLSCIAIAVLFFAGSADVSASSVADTQSRALREMDESISSFNHKQFDTKGDFSDKQFDFEHDKMKNEIESNRNKRNLDNKFKEMQESFTEPSGKSSNTTSSHNSPAKNNNAGMSHQQSSGNNSGNTARRNSAGQLELDDDDRERIKSYYNGGDPSSPDERYHTDIDASSGQTEADERVSVSNGQKPTFSSRDYIKFGLATVLLLIVMTIVFMSSERKKERE